MAERTVFYGLGGNQLACRMAIKGRDDQHLSTACRHNIRANNLIGFRAEARDFFHFLRDTVDLESGLKVMYGIDGARVPEEIVVPDLQGYLGSGPVRDKSGD